jgi:hypothetical protein
VAGNYVIFQGGNDVGPILRTLKSLVVFNC